jgi:hypothetical protein
MLSNATSLSEATMRTFPTSLPRPPQGMSDDRSPVQQLPLSGEEYRTLQVTVDPEGMSAEQTNSSEENRRVTLCMTQISRHGWTRSSGDTKNPWNVTESGSKPLGGTHPKSIACFSGRLHPQTKAIAIAAKIHHIFMTPSLLNELLFLPYFSAHVKH